MNDNNVIDDLKSLLEGVSQDITESTRINQEAFSNIDNISLLSEEEKEPEESFRDPSKVLADFCELDKKNLEIDEQIEKFKEEHKEIFSVLADLEEQKKANLSTQDSLKTEMCDSLNKAGLKNVENYMYSVTYVAETTRSNFDRKSFEKKYPTLCKQFITVSKVSAYTKWTKVNK